MIREMRESDCSWVLEIYREAIEEGQSTFTTETPPWPVFNNSHLPYLRYVYEDEGKILGWVAVARIYSALAYSGYLKESIYVKKSERGKGIGKALLSHLIIESEKIGIWGLYGCIFSTNKASIAMHSSLGFRVIGIRERVARDRFGAWLDTTLMERRSTSL